MEVLSGVHAGATVQAAPEPASYRAKRNGQPRFQAAEARNGMPAVLPYSWRACWPGSRRAQLTDRIMASIQEGAGR